MTRVLFIEDSVEWQKTFKELLQTAGYDAKRAISCGAALELLVSKQKIDMIVFDLQLGEQALPENVYVWLDALIEGMKSRSLGIPPIIVVTGLPVTKKQIIQAFTQFHGHIYGFFEKGSFVPKEFMDTIKVTNSAYSSNSKSKNPLTLILYALIIIIVFLAVFLGLYVVISQISDAETRKALLYVGGTMTVVAAIFILVTSQDTNLEKIIESVTKILRR